MSPDKFVLDDELTECLVRAKALAIRDDSPSVTFVHVVRAVVPWKPDLATEALEKAGVGRFTSAPPSDGFAGDELDRAIATRLGLAPDVEATMARLQRRARGDTVHLADVLEAILADPIRRLELSLEGLGLVPVRGSQDTPVATTPMPYESPLEYLRDQIALWRHRRQVAQLVRARMVGRTDAEPTEAIVALRALEEGRERRYWLTDPSVVRDRLGFSDVSREVREILTCLYMEEIFDLDDCSFYQPSVRDLAQWMAPTRYPANCGAVLAAARVLFAQGLMLAQGWPDLGSDVALTSKATDRLVAAQSAGPITEAEIEAFRGELHSPGGEEEESI